MPDTATVLAQYPVPASDVPDAAYIIAAYLLTWVVVVGYTVYVNLRARRASDGLNSELSAREENR